ncbi:hypothetical protein FJR38_04535 [Anabaena sp. UHCC 0253]|uniref:hypothetical protein n=1 Tax=Anabaena sp. UHCC 0253 TaxID=2590019 RepID=UPI001445718D|nr:hypothetical protein [Anabaena sp. UHCC 0253]MTJ51987.1 hypothetical protein [Anabaena sp. UHCC 0253]
MIASNIRQQILDHLQPLPGEQVKTLLLTWLTGTSGELEDFERLLTNKPTQNRLLSIFCENDRDRVKLSYTLF